MAINNSVIIYRYDTPYTPGGLSFKQKRLEYGDSKDLDKFRGTQDEALEYFRNKYPSKCLIIRHRWR